MSDLTKDDLTVGTWVLMKYGFDDQEFCVLATLDGKVLLGKSNWCVSAAMWQRIEQVNEYGPSILGKGKVRWWRNWMPWIRDLIFPFSKPKRIER